MPMKNVPLVKFDAAVTSKKVRERLIPMIARRVQLYLDEKAVKRALSGVKANPKKGIVAVDGLNSELFYQLRAAVKDQEVKSIEFEDEGGRRFEVGMVVYEKGQSKFNKEKAVSTPFEVTCRHCRKTTETTIPPGLFEACTDEGEVPSPTIRVKKIGDEGDGD